MHKLAVLNDVRTVAELLAAPLRYEGYEVMTDLTSIDFERVIAFKPRLIVLGLHRRVSAFDRPIRNIEADVMGFKPLVDMEHYPAISVIPVIILSTGLRERDLPTSLNYDSFLVFPEDADLYFPKIEELIATVKTRRKISRYICPHCGSRLTSVAREQRELFCPRCHTGVVLIDAEHCLMTAPGGTTSKPCTIDMITPHEGDTSDQAEARAKQSDRGRGSLSHDAYGVGEVHPSNQPRKGDTLRPRRSGRM